MSTERSDELLQRQQDKAEMLTASIVLPAFETIKKELDQPARDQAAVIKRNSPTSFQLSVSRKTDGLRLRYTFKLVPFRLGIHAKRIIDGGNEQYFRGQSHIDSLIEQMIVDDVLGEWRLAEQRHQPSR